MAGTVRNDELFAAMAQSNPDLAEPEPSANGSDGTDGAFDDQDVDDDEDDVEAEAIQASRRRVAQQRQPESKSNRELQAPRSRTSRYALAERGVLQVGDIVGGKYRVERVVGRRGSGVIVEGRHLELGQMVTIRHPPREVRARPRTVARFLRDSRAACQIQSEHAARILDVGRLDSGVPYLVMEGLDGWDLQEVLRVRGPLPVEDAVDYIVQASEAIAEAHGLGLMHGSICLSNLILTRRIDGTALIKVIDFGVPDVLQAAPFMEIAAADSESSSLMSSLRFLSPEQIRCTDDVDLRADVWGLGAVLHELLIGAPAFFGTSPGGLLAAIAADPPQATGAVLRGVPPEIVAILLRSLSKDRNARFQSVAELVQALRPFTPAESMRTVERVSRMSIPSRPPPLPASQGRASLLSASRAFPVGPPPKKSAIPGSSSTWLAAAGVVGGLIGAFLAIGTERGLRSAREPAPAEKIAASEPIAKPVASAVAVPAAPQDPAVAAPKANAPAPSAPVAVGAALAPLQPRLRPKPQIMPASATDEPATVKNAAAASAKNAAPTSSASSKGTVASSGAQPKKDLFDDTR
jgi:serine/threonine-protein kinase